MNFMQALGTEGLCSIVTPQLKFLDTQVQEKRDQSKIFQVLAVWFPKMQNQTEQCLCVSPSFKTIFLTSTILSSSTSPSGDAPKNG